MMPIDWPYLRNATAIFACLLIFSVGLVWAVQSYHEKINEDFFQQERDFSSAKRRYDEARRNRAVYQQYLSEYRRHMQTGFIGEEQRLSWIEQLQALNEEYKFASLNYEISPQDKAELPAVNMPSGISVFVSTMDLQVGLLHEGDAVSFWRDYRRQADGFHAIKECELEASNTRRQTAPEYRPSAANVQMQCLLDWYTIKVDQS